MSITLRFSIVSNEKWRFSCSQESNNLHRIVSSQMFCAIIQTLMLRFLTAFMHGNTIAKIYLNSNYSFYIRIGSVIVDPCSEQYESFPLKNLQRTCRIRTHPSCGMFTYVKLSRPMNKHHS